MAVSKQGAIAVGDDAQDRVFLFEPIRDEKGVRTGYSRKAVGQAYDDPDRLIFIGNDLFVVDTEEGKFSLVTEIQGATRTQNEFPVNNLLARIKSESKIQDLAYLNGVFYVVSDGRVFAFTPSSSYKSFPIFKESAKPSRGLDLPRIIASRENLFLKRSQDNYILKLPRPVPVSVNFEPDETKKPLAKNFAEQRGALLYLYEYLSQQDALPTREFIAQRSYPSLKELLFEQHVLIDANYGDQTIEGKSNSDGRLAERQIQHGPLWTN